MIMVMISGGQVGVEGVAARAVFEANQSGISEKAFSPWSSDAEDICAFQSTRILHTKPTSKHDNSEICWPINRQDLYQTNIGKCVRKYRLQRYIKIWSIREIWANIYPIRSESVYTNGRPTSKSLSGCAWWPLVTFGAAQHSKPNQRCRLSV